MTVQEVMTAYPETLDPEDAIRKAAQLMRDHDYGVVPIIDIDGSLVGIITDRDIVVRAVADGLGPDTLLQECMTADPVTIPRDLTIEQAVNIMSSRQIRRIPVVESGRLIGMLSLSDVAGSNAPPSEKASALEDISATGGALRSGVERHES